MHRSAHQVALVSLLLLVASACSTGASPSPSEGTAATPSGMPMTSDDHGGGFAWGEPAHPAEADRVVEVRMLDELRFEPASVEVQVGETITFEVVNAGQIAHDFTLGDEAAQDAHDAEMAEGMAGMGHEEPNSMVLDPGETGQLTWHFSAPGSILYGCHIPGHYAAGMVGTITIAGS